MSAAFILLAGGHAALAATPLAVKYVSVPQSVRRGAPARVEVATVPGAICDIEVRSPAGLVRTAGIRPKKALESGRIVWTWRVGKTMRAGKWKVVVDCLLGEHVGRVETHFVVK
jgi:hypothetical protein